MKENKTAFIKALEDLCHMSRALEDLVIEYGYVDEHGTFVPSETESDSHREFLCFHWKDQERKFGQLQSIEGDSNFGILIDAMKVIPRM